MPSAGRPFTPEVITRLVAKGVGGRPARAAHRRGLAGGRRAPLPRARPRPRVDRRAGQRAPRRGGHRVVAVGTTVVRALETAGGQRRPGPALRRLDRPGRDPRARRAAWSTGCSPGGTSRRRRTCSCSRRSPGPDAAARLVRGRPGRGVPLARVRRRPPHPGPPRWPSAPRSDPARRFQPVRSPSLGPCSRSTTPRPTAVLAPRPRQGQRARRRARSMRCADHWPRWRARPAGRWCSPVRVGRSAPAWTCSGCLDGGPDYAERLIPALGRAFEAPLRIPQAGGGRRQRRRHRRRVRHRRCLRPPDRSPRGAPIGATELRVGVPFPAAALEILRHACGDHGGGRHPRRRHLPRRRGPGAPAGRRDRRSRARSWPGPWRWPTTSGRSPGDRLPVWPRSSCVGPRSSASWPGRPATPRSRRCGDRPRPWRRSGTRSNAPRATRPDRGPEADVSAGVDAPAKAYVPAPTRTAASPPTRTADRHPGDSGHGHAALAHVAEAGAGHHHRGRGVRGHGDVEREGPPRRARPAPGHGDRAPRRGHRALRPGQGTAGRGHVEGLEAGAGRVHPEQEALDLERARSSPSRATCESPLASDGCHTSHVNVPPRARMLAHPFAGRRRSAGPATSRSRPARPSALQHLGGRAGLGRHAQAGHVRRHRAPRGRRGRPRRPGRRRWRPGTRSAPVRRSAPSPST